MVTTKEKTVETKLVDEKVARFRRVVYISAIVIGYLVFAVIVGICAGYFSAWRSGY